MTETTEQVKQPQQYEEGNIYSLDSFMDIKQVNFYKILQRLERDGYIKRYGLIPNYNGKYIETNPNMTTSDLNKYSFQLMIKNITGLRLGRLVKFDDTEAIKYINSDSVSDKRYITTDFKISDIDTPDSNFVMCDYLYATSIFSIMQGGILRFTFREMVSL